MAAVSFQAVEKRFGDVRVIEHLDLDVADQEFLVLVGPSGCGKSTALRMVAGLETPSGGTISIGGRVVNDVAPKDRDIAMVFQGYALYPHMTVRDNLAFALKMRKTSNAEIERRVRQAAELLDLTELLQRRPRELSGGQQQRVAVGRAIVRRPAVFLFDEPLSNLDAKLRAQMRTEIARLQRELKATTIYVTHDQVEAMTMGQRIAVLDRGALRQLGTPLEIYDRPADRFVASFIGTPAMNMLTATVDGDARELVGAGFRLPLSGARAAAARSHRGRAVSIGIRSENLLGPRLATHGATAPLRLEVESVELLGPETIVHGRLGADRLVARFEPHTTPTVGEVVEVTLEVDRLHLFDPESEKRLEMVSAETPR